MTVQSCLCDDPATLSLDKHIAYVFCRGYLNLDVGLHVCSASGCKAPDEENHTPLYHIHKFSTVVSQCQEPLELQPQNLICSGGANCTLIYIYIYICVVIVNAHIYCVLVNMLRSQGNVESDVSSTTMHGSRRLYSAKPVEFNINLSTFCAAQ